MWWWWFWFEHEDVSLLLLSWVDGQVLVFCPRREHFVLSQHHPRLVVQQQ
jgi:hypothetical protein